MAEEDTVWVKLTHTRSGSFEKFFFSQLREPFQQLETFVLDPGHLANFRPGARSRCLLNSLGFVKRVPRSLAFATDPGCLPYSFALNTKTPFASQPMRFVSGALDICSISFIPKKKTLRPSV